MSGRVKSWLLWIATTICIVAALAVTTVYIVIGTESGTRWVLGRAAAFTPVTIDTDGVRGTLLTRVLIPLVAFEDPDRVVRVENLTFNIDWSGSGIGEIGVERLEVALVGIRNTAPVADPSPLAISLPELPLAVRLDSASIGRLALDDLRIDDIELESAALERRVLTVAAIEGRVDAIGAAIANLSATFEADIPLNAAVEWQVAESSWSGRAELSGDLRQLQLTHALAGEFPARTTGSLYLLGRTEPRFDVVTEFDGWRIQQVGINDARVQLAGTWHDYTSQLAATVTADPDLTARVTGNVTGNIRGLESVDLAIGTPFADAQVAGRVTWSPQLDLDLRVSAHAEIPAQGAALSKFFVPAAGSVDAEARVTARSVEQFVVAITSLSGRWQDNPLHAAGELSRRGSTWRCAGCVITVGANRIAVDGAVEGRRISGEFDMDAPDLRQAWPGAAGSLIADGAVRGSLTLPILSGAVTASAIEFGEWKVGSLTALSRNSTLESVDFAVVIADLARAGRPLGGGTASLAGSGEDAQLTATWNLDDYSTSIDARLRIGDDSVSGTIATASITEPYIGTWEIPAPIEFSAGPARLEIGSGEWRNGDARIRHAIIAMDRQLLRVDASLARVPLDVANAGLPDTVRIGGLVDASASIQRTAAGWNGDLAWRQAETVLTLRPQEQDEFRLNISTAEATLRLQDSAAVGVARVEIEPYMQAVLDLALEDVSADARGQARLQLSGNEWNWVSAFIPVIDEVKGTLKADLTATGSVLSPDLEGSVRWSVGELAIPGLNLPLTDIDLALSGASAGDLTVDGRATSGGGQISVSGHVRDITSDAPSFSVELAGREAALLNWPGYQVTASPELTVDGARELVVARGRVVIDRAEIAVRELPEGSVRPSGDVTVEGREAESGRRTPVRADLQLVLTDKIHVQAFGLDTNVEGQLRFLVEPNREPEAQGELRLVGGVFEAYGQRLTIEQGRMIFTGPLDDPLIDVRAVRTIDGPQGTVTAGIHLTGQARNLNSSVYAQPAMSEAEALSYLILGRPLEDATSADGSNLSNTAYALGLRQAATITNQIGQSVGLDELRVSGSNENTTELVAGKQVNSRLYARYAYGVFTRLGRLLLEYRLSKSFTVEIGAGQTQSMDIMYTVERE